MFEEYIFLAYLFSNAVVFEVDKEKPDVGFLPQTKAD